MAELNINKQIVQEDDIDLIALIKVLLKGRKIIIKIILLFLLIGLLVAIFSPKQYTVTTVMVPQVSDQSGKLGGLSSLAAMAGFNLDMGGGAELSPVIYPQIVQSAPFRQELMQTKLKFARIKKPISYFDYYTNYRKKNLIELIKLYTIGLPRLIKGYNSSLNADLVFIDTTNILKSYSRDELELVKVLNKTVYLDVEERDGYIKLSCTMPEAIAAAQLGQKAIDLLQLYITNFKIKKAEEQLKFVEERYNAKKKDFEKTQKKLATFRDQNKNIGTEIARTKLEYLQSEYQIAQTVYTELAKQLENAKIKVKEDSPVFSIIEPIKIPTETSKPKRGMILFVFLFIGVLSGVGFVLFKRLYSLIKKQWAD